MRRSDDDTFDPAIRKLERLATLHQDDRQMLRTLPFEARQAEAGAYLVRAGDDATTCSLLLTGYVCRHKKTNAGGRQIVSFHVPGDILDLQKLLLSKADHNIQTITEVTFAAVPAVALKQATQRSPGLAEAFWRDTLIEASVFRE